MRRNVFPCTETSLVDRRDSVTGMFFPSEHNIATTFPLSGKTFCRVSNFSGCKMHFKVKKLFPPCASHQFYLTSCKLYRQFGRH